MKFEEVDETDWEDAWKRYYHPTHVTETLVVVPSWETYTPTSKERVIQLDPGMAFGTGTHPTTSLMLRLLEEKLKPGDILLDVGCGSGILSIAGAKLGASSVLALDLDPVAVRVTQENCQLNQVENIVEVKQNNLLKNWQQEWTLHLPNLIVSNILVDVLLFILEDAYRILAEDGFLLLSGIINTRLPEMQAALVKEGFQVVRKLQESDWVALEVCKSRA